MALKMTPEKAILELLKKEESNKDTKDLWNVKDTNTLWNKLKEGPLKSMRSDKGLIKLLKGKENHISRMWEIAVGTDYDIAVLRDPNDPNVKRRSATAFHGHAVAAINAMLPQAEQADQADQPHVKWIGRRGKKNEGRDTLYFPWESSSKGFKEEFEMTISNGDEQNEYYVHIGDIGGENSKKHQVAVDIPGDILLSVERNIDRLHPLHDAVKSPVRDNYPPKSCVMAFTFGVAPRIIANKKNLALKNNQKSKEGSNEDQIIVYIRFAGPTMLVGKAFKANWATKNGNENLWGDLVLVKY